jgi:DNA-binding XRE family transcriptional regulator
MESKFPASTFGHIYQKALQSHLKNIGSTLSLMRRIRRKDINDVAAAIKLRPETLLQIEDGKLDFRVKTLFALCDYYEIDIDKVVSKGELLHFKLA